MFKAEPATTATSGFWPFKRLARLIGFITSDKKGQRPTTSLLLLGAIVPISKSFFISAETPERVVKIRGRVAQPQSAEALTPDAASKLRWRLGFYPPLLAGKIGRGMMWPLIARQYWERYRALDGVLRRNLSRLYAAIGSTFVG